MKAKDRTECVVIKRCIKTPIRALSRAKDLYVQSMNSLANGMSNNFGNCPKTSLPKGYRINSSLSMRNNEDDFLELLRVASTETLSRSVVVDDQQEFPWRQQPASTPEAVQSVPVRMRLTIGRIDEDRVCDFGDDNLSVQGSALRFVCKKQKLFLCPRTRRMLK
ncbi:hypothetical protein DCAR_0312281 [Daucus carota subsp. sativus]|uniref:Uncharacterized protein n=1 Tax=Daucus carota subsp. sativus TaxID=79200 RepID=A0A161WTN9_DAUCS|nr:PREDICTED: uncharacterized protein LOC108213750 [Daucus carota subsp. sativus]WOG93002.1 hypothetical protein DCAR_0312281 [Daucus carota subsp. sativus]